MHEQTFDSYKRTSFHLTNTNPKIEDPKHPIFGLVFTNVYHSGGILGVAKTSLSLEQSGLMGLPRRMTIMVGFERSPHSLPTMQTNGSIIMEVQF